MSEKTKEELEKELAELNQSNESNDNSSGDLSEIEKLKQQLKDNAEKELKMEKEKMEKELKELRDQINSFKEVTMSDKQKEEQTKLLKEQAEQAERQRLLDEIENLKVSQQRDKLDKAIIEKTVKDPHLKGHIEHVQSQEELDALIKREGDTWKKLYAYENRGSKNTKVTNGYRTNNNASDEAVLKSKVENWSDVVKRFLPKHGLQK